MFFPLQLVLSGGCCVIVLVALPAHCRLANITFYLLLATSTPASPCHSKKVSYSSALVVYSPGFCSYTMYSCCCCRLCLLLIFRLSGISPVSTFVPLHFVFHTSSSRCPTPYLRFTYCVQCLRIAATAAAAAAAAATAFSCHGFPKVGLLEAGNNRYFFGLLSKPNHSHNNPGYLCTTLNTLCQVTPRQ